MINCFGYRSGKSKECEHEYFNDHDYEKERTYIKEVKCNKCDYYDEIIDKESRWRCKGF